MQLLSEEVYPDIGTFLRSHTDILKYNYAEDRIPAIKVTQLKYCGASTESHSISSSTSGGVPIEYPPVPVSAECNGPKEANDNCVVEIGDIVTAETISNYPAGSGGWSIICDTFRVRIVADRVLIALADGCNWGQRPREASERASFGAIEYMTMPSILYPMQDLFDATRRVLQALMKAHEAVIAGHEKDIWSCGTTTLLCSIILPIAEPFTQSEWAFVCASVGDCKAFHWSAKYDQVSDITYGNRINSRDARDCGGRLGPYLKGGTPDVRNLSTYFWPCSAGDIIIICSDGVHDNLDPEILGKTPRELDLEYDTWDDVPNEIVQEVKSAFSCKTMADIISKCPEKSTKLISRALIQHAVNLTGPTLKFMEENPQLPEPKDYVAYPGKMDHTTCICILVGAETGESNDTIINTSGERKKRLDKVKRVKRHKRGPPSDIGSPFNATTLLESIRPIVIRKIDRSVRSTSMASFNTYQLTNYFDTSSGWSLSLYPARSSQSGGFMRDPFTEQYQVDIHDNRLSMILAGASGYGPRAANAAQVATAACANRQEDLRDTQGVAYAILQSIEEAHIALIKGEGEESDTPIEVEISLLAGIACRLPSLNESQPVRWLFVCANVGDNKAFHWDSERLRLTDITSDSLLNDLSDYGGRIGTLMYDGGPDLSNLKVYTQSCSETGEDLLCMAEFLIVRLMGLVFVSPTVYLNFDPMHMGLKPKDLNLPSRFKKWEKSRVLEEARTHYRVREMERIIQGISDRTSEHVTSELIRECQRRTESKRAQLQNLAESVENLDAVSNNKTVGRLGHASCVCIRVGKTNGRLGAISAGPSPAAAPPRKRLHETNYMPLKR